MEKVIDIAKNVAIVILALIVAFILFIGLGKLASYAFSSLASAGASLTSVFVPATTTPQVVVVGGNNPVAGAPGAYSTSSAVMTVQSQPAQTAPVQTQTTGYTYPSTVHTTYVAPRVSYYGLPDLAVSVVATGIVNSAGTFVSQPVVYSGERAAVQVLVSNVGTNVSGAWILQAPLPTNQGGETFTSYPQASLAPGASAKLTLSFDDLRNANVSSMVITVDPYNQVAESNKSNNTAVATFQESTSYGYGTNYNAGYNYTYPTNTNTYYNSSYSTNSTCSGNSTYYSNGSYYTYPCDTNDYPYTTYEGNWNSSSYLPDLTISIISVTGNSSSYNNSSYSYYNGSYYNGSNQVMATIQITNAGQSTSGNYTFNAGIGGSNQYTSPSEPSLAAGQSATYTINLNQVYSSGNTLTATVNPYNTAQESNYSNNTVTRSF